MIPPPNFKYKKQSDDILLPIPISSGVKDPHCTTLHIVCNSSTQNAIVASTTSRVNNGSRRTYDRSRDGLNGSGGRAAGGAIVQCSALCIFFRVIWFCSLARLARVVQSNAEDSKEWMKDVV